MGRVTFGTFARGSIKNQSPRDELFLHMILWLLIALIAAPCARAGTFRDDFEDGNLDGWRQDFPVEKKPTLWKIVKGELECTRQDSISTALITGDITWKDYTIEYDMKLLEDFGNGDVDMLLRYMGFDNQILVGVGDFFGAPEVFAQALPANRAAVRKPFDSLKLNEWHHLKAEAKGKNFTLWLNGEEVFDYIDDNVQKNGAVGIGLANYTARFDNVEISGSDVPNVTPKTWKARPIEPRDKLATTWGQLKAKK